MKARGKYFIIARSDAFRSSEGLFCTLHCCMADLVNQSILSQIDGAKMLATESLTEDIEFRVRMVT